jgi:hypothetical protein
LSAASVAAESQEARGFLLENPDAFLLYYFPDRIRTLKDFHLRLLHTATRESRGLILYPAAHGKTTLVSERLPIWAICRDPNIRMAVIAKNGPDATAITRSIQSELLGNDRLIADFGPFRPEGDDSKAWALERFDVAARTRRGKSSTFAAFGAGSRNALGYRTDWTICDDVVTDVNSSTPEQREKLRMWFNQGPETMGDQADARLTVVGTRFHPEDLYGDFIEMVLPDSGKPIWYVQTEYAVLDPDNKVVLWPEERPWIWLMRRKAAMGTLDFNKRYNNVAVDPSRLVFKEEYVRGGYVGKIRYPGCLDKHYCVGDYDPSWRRYAGFDPAAGKLSRSAKFCAHIEVAVGSCADHEKCLWIVDLHRDQMTLPQQVELILNKHRHYDNYLSVIEANAYQVGLYEEIKRRMDEAGVAYNIKPHYTSRMNKPDPELGVQSMAPWFENGKVHIPWGNPESQRKMQILVDELVQYPGRTTDTVMALWMAYKWAHDTAPRFQSGYYVKKPLFSRYHERKRYAKNPYYVERTEAA